MKNFGFIKTIYNNMLSEAISDKTINGKKHFKTYLKKLKESEVLKTQFLIYKNIENKIEENETRIIEYIKENISLMDKFSKKQILDSNKRLAKGVALTLETYKNNEVIMKLHKNISYLINTHKSAKTIDTIFETISEISDYIKNNTKKKITEPLGVSNDILTSIVVEKYNEKYKDLSESSKKLINTILESTQPEKTEFFKSIIKDCLGIINEQIIDADMSLKESLLSVKENLLNRVFNESTFEVDILKMFQLKKDLND
tara:strand:- start:858 stop:1631 length:774 start_codon:yes stop_codon:yes gene_type:complete